MLDFKHFFLQELKRLVRTRNVIILSVFFLACLCFVQYGIGEYKEILSGKEKFQDFELQKIEQYHTYTQYGGYGIRVFFCSHPMGIYFINSGRGHETNSFFDSGERLKIYNSLIGSHLFKLTLNNSGITDFAGILLLIGGLLALFYGYGTFRNRDFLKLLAPLRGDKKVFWFPVISRFIIILSVFLALSACAVLMVLLNHIPFTPHSYMLHFLVSAAVVLWLAFALGAAIGTIKSREAGISILMGAWALLFIFIPAALDFYSAGKSNNITPLYKLEMDKLKIVMAFEKRTIDEAGTFNYGKNATDKDRELLLSYYNNEFKEIHAREEAMRGEMLRNIRHCHLISSFFPSTFYLSVGEELSGQGALNLMEFYRYTQDLKKKFFKFYMDKIYFSEERNFSPIENFIEGDENIYYASSRLPRYYPLGLLLNFFYTVLILCFGYFRFKTYLYSQPQGWENALKNPGLKLKKEKLYTFHVKDRLFSYELYSLLSGRGRLFRQLGVKEMYIDDQPMVYQPFSCPFLYLGRVENLPDDITAGDAIRLTTRSAIKTAYAAKRLHQLTLKEKEDFYFTILSHVKRPVYLIDDIAKGMDFKFTLRLREHMADLADEGALVFYLTTDFSPHLKNLTKNETYYKHDEWVKIVDSVVESFNINAVE
jgi:hypothetical protein